MMDVTGEARKAARYHIDGYNCAECVSKAVMEALGVEKKCVPRVATPFGAGIGRMGQACGALTGGAMVIGLLYGRDDPEDLETKVDAYRKVQEFYSRFEKENGSVTCREMIGVDLNTEEGMQEVDDRELMRTHCDGFIANATGILLDLIEGWGH